jgi:hypothetical protein
LTGELTPAQHARIRRQLALIPVYIWVVYSWTHLLVRIPQDEPVRDFVHFYVQGVIARDHDAASLYDINRMADIAQRVLPGGQRVMYPPVYGPQVPLLFLPMASLGYVAARNLWVIITILIYAAAGYALWRRCPRLRDQPWTTALLLTAAPSLHYVLGFVQVSALALVCVTAAYLTLRGGHPFLAGLAFGSLAYKPPLAIGVAVVLAGAALLPGRFDARRTVAGAVIAAVVQLAIGAAYWGASILPDYAAALTRVPDVANAMEPNRFHMHSWRTFFDLLGLPAPIALGAYACASVVTTIGALVCWLRRGPLALRYAALLIATVLVDPHLYAYDLLILIPAFMLLWDWVAGEPDKRLDDVVPWLAVGPLRGRSFNTVFLWLVYICYLSPLFVTVADVARLQLSPLLLALLGAVILTVLGRERRGVRDMALGG